MAANRNSSSSSSSSSHSKAVLEPFNLLLEQYKERLTKEQEAAEEELTTQLSEHLTRVPSEKEKEIITAYVEARKQQMSTQLWISIQRDKPGINLNDYMAKVLQIDEYKLQALVRLTQLDEFFFDSKETAQEKRIFFDKWKDLFYWASDQLAQIKRSLALARLSLTLNLLKYIGIPFISDTFLHEQSNQAISDLSKFLSSFSSIFIGFQAFKYGRNGIEGCDVSSIECPFPGDAGKFVEQIIINLHEYRQVAGASETILKTFSDILFSYLSKMSFKQRVDAIQALLASDYLLQCCETINEKSKQKDSTGYSVGISADLIDLAIADVMTKVNVLEAVPKVASTIPSELKTLMTDYNVGEKKPRKATTSYASLFVNTPAEDNIEGKEEKRVPKKT